MTISVGIAVIESPLAGATADMVEAAGQALYRESVTATGLKQPCNASF